MKLELEALLKQNKYLITWAIWCWFFCWVFADDCWWHLSGYISHTSRHWCHFAASNV